MKEIEEMDHCPSHEYIHNAVKRQEEILDEFRKENTEHNLHIASAVAEICTELKTIREIKTTQIDNMRRREDFSAACEGNRKELWEHINNLGIAQNGHSFRLLSVEAKAEAIKLSNDVMKVAVDSVKTRQDKKDGSLIILVSLATTIGAAAASLLSWLQGHGGKGL